MGLTDYPYRSLKLLIHVNFIAYGERNGPLNPFQWRQANLNLPVDESYTPKLPLVMKVISDGYLATDVFIYVDDSCIIAHSDMVCWQAAERFCFIYN